MKSKINQKDTRSKNDYYKFTPLITTIAFPILFGRRKKIESPQEKTSVARPKPKELLVAKYELTDSVVKFSVVKGFPKKRWVLIKEIPIHEITSIENFENELRITWNGSAYLFVLKNKYESFSALRDQIQSLLEEHKKILQKNENTDLRKADLIETINASISVVNLSFNILMSLHKKRVDWARLESYSESLGNCLRFTGQILEPLNTDFSRISAAIKKQIPKETSKETYNTLKAIYEYFNSLKPEKDLKEIIPNLENAKAIILAYFMLNDILFGRVIGEEDDVKELLSLETTLVDLTDHTKIRIDIEKIKANINRFEVESDNDAVEESRAVFREFLKLL